MGQINVHVVPNASAPCLEIVESCSSDKAAALRVRLVEKAQDGRANKALSEWLAELSGIPVQIVRGHKSRRKTVAFAPTCNEFLSALQQGLRKQGRRA